MKIVRMKLTPDDISPPNIRYNSSCDCVQQSPDSGTTWVDNPALDPRHATSFERAMTPTSDTKCDAAARMTAYVKDQVNNFIQSVSAAQAGVTALQILLLAVPEVGWLFDLFILAGQAVIALEQANIEAAFTDAVYDKLQCIFLANVNPDGSITAAALANVQSDFNTQVGGVAAGTLNEIGAFTGEVGFSNAAAERTNTGDCTSCNNWCYNFADASNLGVSWTVVDVTAGGIDYTGGSYSGGVWNSQTGGNMGNDEVLGIKFTSTSPVTHITVTWHASEGASGGARGVYLTNGSTDAAAWTAVASFVPDAGDHTEGFAVAIAADAEMAVLCHTAGGAGHPNSISDIQLQGTGTNPVGTDNC